MKLSLWEKIISSTIQLSQECQLTISNIDHLSILINQTSFISTRKYFLLRETTLREKQTPNAETKIIKS